MRTLLNYLALSLAFQSTAYADSFDYNISISFEQISRFYRAAFQTAMSKVIRIEDCALVGTSQDTRPIDKRYRCGEVPVGSIESATSKKLMSIDIPAKIDDSGDLTYWISAGNVNVYMSRVQKAGEVLIPNLTEKGIVPTEVTSGFGTNLFFQMDPRSDRLLNRFCLALPGLSISTSPAHLVGKIHKHYDEWYIPDIRADLKIDINLGKLSFDKGRICGYLITTVNTQGLPDIKLDSLGLPYLDGVDYKGLTVDVDANVSGIWGVIDGILSTFGINIENSIANQVKAKVMAEAQKELDITPTDIKSGTWFPKYVNTRMVQKAVEEFSANLQNVIKSIGPGKDMNDRIVQAACFDVSNQLALPIEQKKKAFQICAHSVKLQTKYFLNNSTKRAAGCYSYQFNPFKAVYYYDENGVLTLPWWAQGCQLDNQATVTVSPKLRPLTTCLLNSFKAHLDPKEACAVILSGYINDLRSGNLDSEFAALTIKAENIPNETEYFNMYVFYYRSAGVRLPAYSTFVPYWK